MTARIPFPSMKYPLVAILRGLKPEETPATIEVLLDVRFGERHARRAAVDDAADRRAVRFAEGRDAEQRAERVAGHGRQAEKGAATIARDRRRLACAAGSLAPPRECCVNPPRQSAATTGTIERGRTGAAPRRAACAWSSDARIVASRSRAAPR